MIGEFLMTMSEPMMVIKSNELRFLNGTRRKEYAPERRKSDDLLLLTHPHVGRKMDNDMPPDEESQSSRTTATTGIVNT